MKLEKVLAELKKADTENDVFEIVDTFRKNRGWTDNEREKLFWAYRDRLDKIGEKRRKAHGDQAK